MGVITKGIKIAISGQIPFESQKILDELRKDENTRKALEDSMLAFSNTSYWYGALVGTASCMVGLILCEVVKVGSAKFKTWRLNRKLEKIRKTLDKLADRHVEMEETPEETEETEDEPEEA